MTEHFTSEEAVAWARPNAVDASQDFRFIKIYDFTVPLFTHPLPAQPAEKFTASPKIGGV